MRLDLPRYRDLSLRFKIPLRVIALVLTTAVVVTGSLIYREGGDLRRSLLAGAESLGRILAETLVAPLTHDDVWRAFEVVMTPYRAIRQGALEQRPDAILVLDERGLVFVSSRPGQYPVLGDPAHHDEDYRQIAHELPARASSMQPWVHESRTGERLHMIVPIVSDGIVLGNLILSYSEAVFLPHYHDLVRRAGLVALAAIAILVPAGWYWANRIARPLIQLSHAMASAGANLQAAADVAVYESRDEVGQLGTAFRRMLAELREKAALEREVVVSDRLAALGRLAAGIAHEINNPLGGMLNAVNTYKRHGGGDPMATKTLSMLERGLTQIRNTVAALLVEAKVETRALTPEDIEDIHTLVLADAQKKQARVTWHNELSGQVPLPSTLVRQVLLNLLLNAVQAIEDGGAVVAQIGLVDDRLRLRVTNDGRQIPEARLPFLFEPFARGTDAAPGGLGLGLWVTYQIVSELGGVIAVSSGDGETSFSVELPVGGRGA